MTKGLRRVARSTVVVVGAVGALAIVVMALGADVLAPHPPDEQNFDLIEARPGAKAVFGTDRFGRDVLSRVIYGARVSLYVAVTSTALAMLVGGAFGLTAGYAGGTWDNAINRVMDVFFSIPGLLLAVGIAAMRGPGVNSAVVAITILQALRWVVLPKYPGPDRGSPSTASLPPTDFGRTQFIAPHSVRPPR